jgi:protein-tyrosine kinase
MNRGPGALKRSETVHKILHTVNVEPSSQPASHPPGSDDLNSLLAHCHRANWKPDSERMIFFASSQPTPGTEELRALRSRLYLVRESQPMKSLLISSALREEGKSFIAANLAHVLALQQECRVLLIDGDLRRPRLPAMLGTSATPGLSEYLLDEVEELGILQRGRPENLFFIPAGRSVPGPTELLANGHLANLLKRLEPVFDWIIVDSPAAVPVSDASLLGTACDGVLLVVRSGSTPYDIARIARERFRQNQLLGVVLNSVQNGLSLRSQY